MVVCCCFSSYPCVTPALIDFSGVYAEEFCKGEAKAPV